MAIPPTTDGRPMTRTWPLVVTCVGTDLFPNLGRACGQGRVLQRSAGLHLHAHARFAPLQFNAYSNNTHTTYTRARTPHTGARLCTTVQGRPTGRTTRSRHPQRIIVLAPQDERATLATTHTTLTCERTRHTYVRPPGEAAVSRPLLEVVLALLDGTRHAPDIRQRTARARQSQRGRWVTEGRTWPQWHTVRWQRT